MEKRSGFWKFDEVLGHVQTAPSKARKHRKSFSKEAIFGGEEEEELPRNKSLDLEQKRVGEDGFRKEDDEKMSHLTNRVPV